MEPIFVELVNNKLMIQGNEYRLKDYFKGYESECESGLLITTTEEDIRIEEDAHNTKYKWKLASVTLEFCAIQRQIASCLSGQGILLFHGSAICVDGRTYIFTASNGVGKSTHTRLWREILTEHNVVMVNDDKPFLKVEEGHVTAYGSPWMGKERLGCNMSATVEAICSISQGTETRKTVRPLPQGQSVHRFGRRKYLLHENDGEPQIRPTHPRIQYRSGIRRLFTEEESDQTAHSRLITIVREDHFGAQALFSPS